jgi:hypothetical protein
VLPLASGTKPLPVQSRLTVFGVPVDHEAMAFLDRQQPSKLESRLLRVAQPLPAPDEGLKRMEGSAPAGHHEQSWSGSPVLNAEGEVVGVYARPSPPLDPAQPMKGDRFDAVLIEQVRQLPLDVYEAP